MGPASCFFTSWRNASVVKKVQTFNENPRALHTKTKRELQGKRAPFRLSQLDSGLSLNIIGKDSPLMVALVHTPGLPIYIINISMNN
jgi:hypothetical protein